MTGVKGPISHEGNFTSSSSFTIASLFFACSRRLSYAATITPSHGFNTSTSYRRCASPSSDD